MRKIRLILLTSILVGLSSVAFACGNEGCGAMQGNMGMMQGGKEMMPGKEMMQGGKEMMHHGVMGKSSMVSSNDGGVIVMIGNTLYKYDKQLNLVKQIELPSDIPQMNMMEKKEMPKMEKKGCGCGGGGTCGQMTQQGGMNQSTQQSQQPQTQNKADADHKSHH